MNTIPITINHCGTCSMCCKLMAVPELDKPQFKWCDKCAPGKGGCTIHETRPDVCRGYECVWLQSQHRRHGEAALPVSLRPDRCHVIIDVRTDSRGLVLHVDPETPEAINRPVVGWFVGSLLRQGQDVIIACGDKRRMLVSDVKGEAA